MTVRHRIVILLIVLVTGAAVRIVGIRHGAPSLIFHPDVSKQAQVARETYRGRSDPSEIFRGDHRLRLYPYGASVLLGRIVRWTSPANTPCSAESESADRWCWALRLRVFSVVSFLVAVGAVLWVCGPDLGPTAMLAAGLLMVLEPWTAQYSHYGMNDVPLVAALLLAWLAARRIPQGGSGVVGAGLCGLALGVAFGIKYQAIAGGLFPVMALWSVRRRPGRLCLAIVLCAAGLAGGAAFSAPLLWTQPRELWAELPRFLAWQADITGLGLSAAEKLPRNARALVALLFASGLWVLLPGAVRAARLAATKPSGAVARRSALAFAIGLVALILVSRDFVRSNDLLPAIPFVILVSVEAMGTVRARWARVVAGVVITILIGLFASTAARDAAALARPDTRERAREWCRERIPAGARVLRERYTLPIGRADVVEHPIRDLRDPQARRKIETDQVDFVLTSSLAHERFSDPGSPYRDQTISSAYSALAATHSVAAVFEDRQLFFAHPKITVYVSRNATSPKVRDRQEGAVREPELGAQPAR